MLKYFRKKEFARMKLIPKIKMGDHKFAYKKIPQNKSQLNQTDWYGDTPLIAASSYGYIGIVECLVDYGADLDIQNRYGNTALIGAIQNGHIDIAKYLVKKGADVTKTNQEGITAYKMASNSKKTWDSDETYLNRKKIKRYLQSIHKDF